MPQPAMMGPQGAIFWSAKRPLSWSDYRGRPFLGGVEVAVTASSLLWGFECTDATLQIQVAAAFFPERSWVNSELLIGSDRSVLEHERTHFDLTEVFARRMRRVFRTMEQPCLYTDDELAVLGDQFVREEADAQRRYDLETSNGRDPEGQARWDFYAQQLIGSLSQFARPDLTEPRPLLWRHAGKR